MFHLIYFLLNMCLYPRTIKTNSRFISLVTCQRLTFEVPCGRCKQCIESKRRDYELRSLVEMNDVKDADGFAYMTSLTYAKQPTFNGVPCFSRDDIRKFFKRLNRYLQYRGYQITRLKSDGKSFESLLHHFLTCEYGGKRGRVHYHVIFFNKVPGLTVEILYKAIDHAWRKIGFHNPPWNYKDYVLTSNAALNYVAKYVTKPQSFVSIINKLHNDYLLLMDKFIKEGVSKDDERFINVQKMLEVYDDTDKMKSVYPFHLQSNGFGENVFKHFDYEFFMQNGYLPVQKGTKIIKYKLPLYNIRKLFYDLKLDFNRVDPDTFEPTQRYILNDEGVRFFQFAAESRIHRYIDNIFLDVQRIKQIYSLENYERFKNSLSNILKDVNLKDYATFELFYRNTLDCGSKSVYDIIFDRSQNDLSNNVFYFNKDGSFTYHGIDYVHKVNFVDLLKCTYLFNTDIINKYNDLSNLFDTYLHRVREQINLQFIHNEKLNELFKNG